MIGSATLATAAVRAAYSALLPDGLQPGIEVINVLAEHITDRRTRSNFRQVVERSIAAIGDNLTSQLGQEFDKLPANERQAAIHCVTRTIEAGWPQDEALPRALAEPHRLRSQLFSLLGRSTRDELLSEAATEFANRALETCTSAAMALALDVEPIRGRRDWDIWFSVSNVEQRLDDLLGDFLEAPFRRGNDHEFLQFDRFFRSAVIEQLRTVQILGLPVDPDLNRQSLDQTMVPITASLVHRPSSSQDTVIRDGQQEGRTVDTSAPPTLQPLDEVLARLVSSAHSSRTARGVRLMVLGAAGSGKTTFSQWLAYRLSRGKLPAELASLVGATPFFIRLRDVMKQGAMPSNAGIVGLSYSSTSPPGGWIDARMQRAWFMIDGLDEVDPDRLDGILAWIAALEEQFPNANFMITSRPHDELVRPFESRRSYEIWRVDDLAESSAVLATTKWFDALEERDSKWASNETRDRLVAQLLSTTELRELATTPLVVAMLCAFYASGKQSGGLGRTELYKDVCAVLVDLREQGSGLVSQDRLHGDVDAKLRVIGSIAIVALGTGGQSIRLRPTSLELAQIATQTTPNARPILTNDQSDPIRGEARRRDSQLTALEIVGEAFKRIPRYKGYNAEKALIYLLRRSNVFFAPTPFEGEFVHRSIMEHLAAREFVMRDDINGLLNLTARRPQFRPVAFAAADLANETQAERILKHFLSRARAAATAHDVQTEIMGCIRILAGSAVSDQALVDEVHRVATRFLPPRTAEVAELIASLGPEVLPWLLPAERDTDDTQFEVGLIGVLTVGGAEAIPYLSELSKRPQARKFAARFLEGWTRFDLDEYAHAVLRNLDLSEVAVPIRTEKQLDVVATLPTVNQVKVLSKVSSDRRHDLSQMPSLTTVDLSNNRIIRNLSGLRLPEGCTTLVASETSLESLGGSDLSGLKNLWAPRNYELRELDELRRMPELQVLNLASNSALDGGVLELVAGLRKLTNLDLSGLGLPTEGQAFSGLSQLRRLNLDGVGAFPSLSWVGGIPRLRSVTVGIAASCPDVGRLQALPELREVRITNRVLTTTFEDLLGIPGLSKLDLVASDGFTTIPPGTAAGLTDLTLRSSSLVSLEGFERFPRLKMLDLSESLELVTLDGLKGCDHLEVLRLNGCRFLKDIDALAHGLPRLRVVEMLDGVPFVDPLTTLEDRISSGMRVEHDPFDPFGGISS